MGEQYDQEFLKENLSLKTDKIHRSVLETFMFTFVLLFGIFLVSTSVFTKHFMNLHINQKGL